MANGQPVEYKYGFARIEFMGNETISKKKLYGLGIKMKNVIKVEIYHDGEFYCGRCLDFDVFTQGSTLDDLVLNIKEAIQLHADRIIIDWE